MNFEDPNICTMLIDSIVEHSDEWTVEMVGGDPIIHKHKSGIEIWAQIEKAEIWGPGYAKAVKFSKEEGILLFKAIVADRIAKTKIIQDKATKKMLAQFNGNIINKVASSSPEFLVFLSFSVLLVVLFVISAMTGGA